MINRPPALEGEAEDNAHDGGHGCEEERLEPQQQLRELGAAGARGAAWTAGQSHPGTVSYFSNSSYALNDVIYTAPCFFLLQL
jgi:hypothetical protein